MIIPTNRNDYTAGFADGYRQGKKDAERKRGRWIVYEVANTEEEQPIAWECSECEEVVDCKYNFCPNCGVYMRGK